MSDDRRIPRGLPARHDRLVWSRRRQERHARYLERLSRRRLPSRHREAPKAPEQLRLPVVERTDTPASEENP